MEANKATGERRKTRKERQAEAYVDLKGLIMHIVRLKQGAEDLLEEARHVAKQTDGNEPVAERLVEEITIEVEQGISPRMRNTRKRLADETIGEIFDAPEAQTPEVETE